MMTELDRIKLVLKPHPLGLTSSDIGRRLKTRNQANTQRAVTTLLDRGELVIAGTTAARLNRSGRKANLYALAGSNWLQHMITNQWPAPLPSIGEHLS